MLIVSQNALNHNIQFPDSTVYRINLAWINSIQELETLLTRYNRQSIFLDLPKDRVKPPNNRYSIEDLIPIINSNEQIRYLAISNVESNSDLQKFLAVLPKTVTIIPKIESVKAIDNLQNIASSLADSEQIFMLDHNDLFSDVIKQNETESKFKEYLKILIEFCDKNNIKLLREIGVVFNDEEKRVTQYVD